MKYKSRKQKRSRRHRRIRRKIEGTAERPRMSVSMSRRYMYVQLIDDREGKTLASVGSFGSGEKNNCETARALGARMATVASEKGIRDWVVDRGGFKFGSRLKAFVDGARESDKAGDAADGSEEQAGHASG